MFTKRVLSRGSQALRSPAGRRFLSEGAPKAAPAAAPSGGGGGAFLPFLLGAGAGAGAYHLYATGQLAAVGLKGPGASVDYNAVQHDIAELIDADSDMGPTLVRLGWHASGTFDPRGSVKGGSSGATMRFDPERSDGANAGLDKARAFLEPIKAKYPGLTYADLWTLAAKTAIEEMGGPLIAWRPGRPDLTAADETKIPPNGRLPDADKKSDHIRALFVERMGFTERETVALIGGGHAIGRCHKEASGYHGPWTRSPTTFSNSYFVELFGQEWVKIKLDTGKEQYVDKATGELMMLEADMELMRDPAFAKISKEYKDDETQFQNDFASAFAKLLELGCSF